MEREQPKPTGHTRRGIIGALGLGAVGAGWTGPAVAEVPAASGKSSSPPAAAQSPGGCILTPQAVEGPFYFDPALVRSDISENRPGVTLLLGLKIVDAATCDPLAGIRVDVWHADARGIYSGYGGQGDAGNVSAKGDKYLRGTQFADAAGNVAFRTIYPGWYPGRTPHIHLKCLLDQKTALTGQVYFPDALSAKVYARAAPYTVRATPDTTNATDWIFKSAQKDGGGVVLAIAERPDEIHATLTIGVDRTGRSSAGGSWWGSLDRLLRP